MAGLANTEYVQYAVLVEHMRSHGIDPDAAMAPFVVPFASYHERTKPKGWLEGLVKAYVGDGIAKDFYREMSVFVDDDTREVMARALDDAGESDFVVGVVRDTLKTDRTAGGRLALWGRRLLGEALSQAQAVAVERDAMSALLVGGGRRPRRGRADVHPAHRQPRPADGAPRPVRLSRPRRSAAPVPEDGGRVVSSERSDCCFLPVIDP